MLAWLPPHAPLSPPPAHSARQRRAPRRHAARPPRARSSGASGDDAELAEAFRKGLPEAKQLLIHAQRLAEDATRRELLESLSSRDADAGPGAAAQAPTLAREGLLRAWRDEGASDAAAARLATVCLAVGGRLATPDGAIAKLSQLRRLLPGADVMSMVSRDERVLVLTQASAVVRNLTALALALPSVDAVALATSHPPLLWADDLDAKLAVCMRCLRKWSPRSDAALVLEAHPNLIERVPAFYAQDGIEFFQLPLELQNCMAVGGGGGGVHYKSWAGDEFDNNTD